MSNESSEIIRMFDAELSSVPEHYPEAHRDEIDALNAVIYERVNNGVYRCGFATTQAAYDDAVEALFRTLDMLEKRLSTRRWLVGSRATEADWRLFPTLVRFDSVYHGHFKCDRRRLVDYPALWAYTRDLYQVPGVADTVDMAATRLHYYGSHETINPHRIVPVGPQLDFFEAPGREGLG